jgi:4-coumarate--CoA ligase
VILNFCLHGGVMIVNMIKFDLHDYLSLMQQYKATRARVVPPVAIALAKSPLVEKFNITTLKAIYCGSAPLGEKTVEALMKRLRCPVRQGYGLTETAAAMCVSFHGKQNSGSVGNVIPNVQMKVKGKHELLNY